ncbi:Plant invertase/pectin methylesterase inhibitor superfamily protein [Raphanus sativus]|uniref:Pectinesterase inhibitor-like n=1 Tax=Raphanus sativus TaxID=3726 RepID=A0A6J0JY81_RAPSA|nr:pectinesterase inhibitor-like [Raphanus sativus]XP_056844791.1 pectinesterase inhibitor-like [Raphanus sativus]KAJ4886787.1 Plant invertase/pectin methylesterase inhibitor superfamily protein [Raphanus sativus]
MNNFMKLFAIFLFIQIQIALSQPNLIQQLCKRNRYQPLCVSTLNLDPRSKTSNLQGLASISIEATTKKTNDALTYLISVLRRTGGDRAAFEKYGTCVDQDYGASVKRYLPGAMANLKAKKYSAAIANLQDVMTASGDCENQFAGSCPLPVSQRNKAVHDITDMTTDIIKTFV